MICWGLNRFRGFLLLDADAWRTVARNLMTVSVGGIDFRALYHGGGRTLCCGKILWLSSSVTVWKTLAGRSCLPIARVTRSRMSDFEARSSAGLHLVSRARPRNLELRPGESAILVTAMHISYTCIYGYMSMHVRDSPGKISPNSLIGTASLQHFDDHRFPPPSRPRDTSDIAELGGSWQPPIEMPDN